MGRKNKYSSDEERKAVRRKRKEEKRREQGIKPKRVFNSEEERKEALKESIKKAGEKYRRKKGIKPRRKFNSEEERKEAERLYGEKKRRKKGMKPKKIYANEEEQLNAKKERAKIRLENSLKLVSKVCIKCNIEKEIKHFKLRKETGSYRGECNKCKNEALEEWKKKNPEKVKEMSKRAYKKAFEKDPEKFRQKSRKWKQEHSEEVRLKQLERYWNNPEKYRKISKEWKEKNPEQVKKDKENFKKLRPNYKAEYFQKNKKRINERNKSKPHIGAWRKLLKRVIRRAGTTKEDSTLELLKYSALQLKQRIECQFTEGMTWDNYGEWHIDHIKRVSEFDKETPPHIVNMLCNLRPLWATTREINGIVYIGNLNRG